MEHQIKLYNKIAAFIIFIILPVYIYAAYNFPRRSLLKEGISIITILAFFIMLLQFYLSRANKTVLQYHKMRNIIKWHKVLGYIFVSILFIHPFLIVLPRYFESGIAPIDAFITIITKWNSTGIKLGIVAWVLMILLGITAMFRSNLGINYKIWRYFHGLLSLIFIVLATWHAVYIGRHTNTFMSFVMIALASGGIILLLKTYLFSKAGGKK